jgi:hypothetical protein
MQKRLAVALCIALAAGGVIVFSLYQTRRIGELEKAPPRLAKQAAGLAAPVPLVPANPADYGMIVFDDAQALLSDEEAAALISRRVKELKARAGERAGEKIRQKVSSSLCSPQEKIKQIEAQIEKCRQLLQANPQDEELRQKVRRLTIMKSLAADLP